MRSLGPLVIALVISIASPTSARADDREYRLSPYLLVAGAGDMKVNSSGASGSTELDTNASVGFGARFETPLNEFLSIGGLFEYAALQRAGVDLPFVGRVSPDKDKLIDFDVWLKAGTSFDLGPGELEVYGGVPFGLTLGVTNVSGDRETYPGYNLGLLGGAHYWFDASGDLRFGLFTELGYRFHKVIDREVQGTDTRASFRISQLAWHLGGSVAF